MVTENAADLAACFATKRSVMIAGRLVEIRAFGIERLQQFAAFLLPAYDNPVGFIATAATSKPTTDPEVNARAVLLASIDADQEWLNGISPEDRALLAVEIVEVNESGFRSGLRLQDRVTGALLRMSGAGATPSNTSDPTATPIPENSRLPSSSAASKPSAATSGVGSTT